MRCLRIYATPDGESHFDEIDIPTIKLPILQFRQFSEFGPFRRTLGFTGTGRQP
jgi:hypothetical protein